MLTQVLYAEAQVFDPTDPNEAYLKELVIQKINAKRAKRKIKPLLLNDALQQTADQYIAQYRYTKFETNDINKRFMRKKVKKKCVANGYKNGFVDFQITAQNAMNYYGTTFYYDKEDTESQTHLFLGDKPSQAEKKEPEFKPVFMKTYTYDEVATLIVRSFIKDDGYFVNLNNGFENYGFSVAVDKRTMFRRRIPKLKMLLIVGGRRITW